jgi:hypothetical protein
VVLSEAEVEVVEVEGVGEVGDGSQITGGLISPLRV